MKTLLSRLATGLLIVGIAFFGLKGCVVHIWDAPKEPTTYSTLSADGRMFTVIFLPKHETLLLYTPDSGKSLEASLTEMKGVYGTHYFWRLWNIEGPSRYGGLFGYRLYPDGFSPVMMETTVKKKFFHGTHKPVFPAEGETTHPLLLFGGDAIEFEGMLLPKRPTNQAFLDQFLPALRE